MTDFWLEFILIAVLGACFGSFITAASWRLPRDMNLVSKSSACPKCDARLRLPDLVPVFSWLFSKGKCRYCKAPISARYVLTEIATSVIFILLFLKYGLTVEFIIITVLAVAFLIMIISDFETFIMPDSTTVATYILAIVYHYYKGDEWADFIAGGAVCLFVALGMKYGFYFITKRDGLGMGDVKFLPAAGLWIGFAALPFYFIMAGIIGIVTGIIWRVIFKNPEYPFGPALAISVFLLIVFPELNLLVMQPK